MKLCQNCITGGILPGEPTGVMIKVGQTDVYHAKATTPVEGAEKKAVVVFSDVFGLVFKNTKILADAFAKDAGIDVYAPDMFNGSPPLNEADIAPHVAPRAGDKGTWWQFFGFVWAALKAQPNMIFYNSNKQVFARMRTFVEDLKKEKGIERVGAVGYCFGGAAIINLAPCHLLDTGVICTPGFVTNKQVAKIDFPVSWVTAEEDFAFGAKQEEQCKAMFAARTGPDKVDFEFKKYMGTKHGFSSRPDMSIPELKQAFEDAFDQTVAWFKKTL